MANRGQPKKFKTGQDLIDLWQQFCDYIVESGYCIAPTQTEFSKWLATVQNRADRKTIYTSLNEYFPTIKSDFEAIRADVITQGAMLGKYQQTMSIFALKNWCNWSDKVENTNTNTNRNYDLSPISTEELRAMLREESK